MQFVMAGILSGVISGLGMGGGVILVVILSYISNFNQLSLQTLNLLYYIPTAIFSIIIYLKNKKVDYKIAFKIIFSAIIPTIISAFIANSMDVSNLKKIFAIYLIAIGGIIFIKSFKQNDKN